MNKFFLYFIFAFIGLIVGLQMGEETKIYFKERELPEITEFWRRRGASGISFMCNGQEIDVTFKREVHPFELLEACDCNKYQESIRYGSRR